MHIADAIATDRNLDYLFPDLDSADLYNDIFNKYKITKAQFDSSIVYYIKYPKKYKKIYDKVFAEISKMESELKDSPENIDSKKIKIIWKDRRTYKSASDSTLYTKDFSIPIDSTGLYIFSVNIKIDYDDESINPRIEAYFWYDNGTETGSRDYFSEKHILKSMLMREYTVYKVLNNDKVTHIKGTVIKRDNIDSSFVKDFIISDMKLGFKKPE